MKKLKAKISNLKFQLELKRDVRKCLKSSKYKKMDKILKENFERKYRKEFKEELKYYLLLLDYGFGHEECEEFYEKWKKGKKSNRRIYDFAVSLINEVIHGII